MSKSYEVRKVLRRHETVFTNDVATEVGCTQPLVFQIISAMEAEGDLFEERQVGRRVSYRLLTDTEAAERRASRKKLEERTRRDREFAKLRDQLMSMKSTIDDALSRLEALAA